MHIDIPKSKGRNCIQTNSPQGKCNNSSQPQQTPTVHLANENIASNISPDSLISTELQRESAFVSKRQNVSQENGVKDKENGESLIVTSGTGMDLMNNDKGVVGEPQGGMQNKGSRETQKHSEKFKLKDIKQEEQLKLARSLIAASNEKCVCGFHGH